MIVTVDYDTVVVVKIYSCVMGNCFINSTFYEWYNEWQRVTTNDNKLQRVTKRMKMVQYTTKPFFCDYFKGCMAAIRVIK